MNLSIHLIGLLCVIATHTVILPLQLNGFAIQSNSPFSEKTSLFSTDSILRKNQEDSLRTLLSGIKYAVIELTAEEQKIVDKGQHPIINRLALYLQQMGLREVACHTKDKTRLLLSVPTYCDLIRVRFDMISKETYIDSIKLKLKTCRNDQVVFTFKEKLFKDEQLFQNLDKAWRFFYNKKLEYNIENRLKLSSNKIVATKQNIFSYFKEKIFWVDTIEGVFEKIPDYHYNSKRHRIAIVKNEEGTYNIIYLDGASNYLDWQEGEWMGEITSLSKKGVFEEVKWTRPDKTLQGNGHIVLKDENTFLLRFKNHPNTYQYQRLESTISLTNTATLDGKGVSGSGFLIDKKGYILTNRHIVESAKSIHVSLAASEEESEKSWVAVLVASDKETDLALLQIQGAVFDSSILKMPYGIEKKELGVGEKVFALGYPFVLSMGLHPKLAVGAISSNYGYQNAAANYQTTVEVYPGNSGSPLFDMKGNLVGIIKNKHADAIKASYVLKSSFILQFLTQTKLFNTNNFMGDSNELEELPLTQQIKKLQPFVFYICAY